jgi:hypothetical protein
MESSLESVKLNANRWEVRAKLGLDNTRNDHAWNKFQVGHNLSCSHAFH